MHAVSEPQRARAVIDLHDFVAGTGGLQVVHDAPLFVRLVVADPYADAALVDGHERRVVDDRAIVAVHFRVDVGVAHVTGQTGLAVADRRCLVPILQLTAYCLVKLAVPPSVYACSLPPLTAVVQ